MKLHRVGFVGEGIPFYGGQSYGRWRRVAEGHSWSGTGSPTVQVREAPLQNYPRGVSEHTHALFTWSTSGIYGATRGPVMVGTAAAFVTSLPVGARFVQQAGVIVGASELLLNLDSTIIMV